MGEGHSNLKNTITSRDGLVYYDSKMASCSSSSDDENMDTFAQITNIVNSGNIYLIITLIFFRSGIVLFVSSAEVIQNGILNRHPTSTPLHLGSSDQRIPKPSLRCDVNS